MMFYIFDYFTPIFVYIVKSTIDFRISLDHLGTGAYHIAEVDLYKVNTKLLSFTFDFHHFCIRGPNRWPYSPS